MLPKVLPQLEKSYRFQLEPIFRKETHFRALGFTEETIFSEELILLISCLCKGASVTFFTQAATVSSSVLL